MSFVCDEWTWCTGISMCPKNVLFQTKKHWRKKNNNINNILIFINSCVSIAFVRTLFFFFSCMLVIILLVLLFHISLFSVFFFLVCSCSVHRRLSFRCDSTLFPLRFVLHTNNTIHQQQQRQQLWLFNVHCYTNSFGYEIFGTNELCTQGLSNKVRKTHT